ncbi:Ribosome biogenesis protein brx1 [Aspergillus nanangensis]|uniref:Ribosome biogenesis protein brx1 n=1 Tax=Aspergillus nanangensis TaxID=2582783 RepID=A0AAD4GRK1_ASPNN|nr:Ribosome biogenesis protein brx1 [Aspergillus nanangensis]
MSLVAIGACYVDTILTTPHYPGEDDKLRASSHSASTNEVQLNLVTVLPARSSIASQRIQSDFEPGVQLSHCIYREQFEEPASSYIIKSQASGSRTIVNYNELPDMTVEEFTKIANDLGPNATWFHFEGRMPDVTLSCIRFLRQAFPSVRVSVEVEKPGRPGLQELAMEADVVFYAKSWAEDGAVALETTHGTLVHRPAYTRDGFKVIDTIGAGDTFIAGMLYGLICQQEKWDMPQKLDFANRVAGMKVAQDGFSALAFGAENRKPSPTSYSNKYSPTYITMASVYKSLSKKEARRLAREEDSEDEDIEMGEFLGEDDSSDSDEDEEEVTAESVKTQLAAGFMPKSRVLMLTSRGVTYRHRHLLADLASLLPHTHKESKLDTKKKTAGYNMLLNSLAELHSCNIIFFLEAKKRGQDLYLWLSRPPNGPTLKFHVNNLHTMSELNAGFSGNCLKGGRGIVVFDRSFDEQGPEMSKPGNEYRGLVREMLRGVFCVPKRGVKGMKPFVDRIIGIFGVDGKIWIRVYELRESEGGSKKEEGGDKAAKPALKSKDGEPEVSLVEIGPRFVLTPIVMLEGSFGGPVIYENKEYVSPNQVRSDVRMGKAVRYAQRRDVQTDRLTKRSELQMGHGERKPGALDTKQIFS